MDGLTIPLPGFLFVSQKGWLEKISLTLSAGSRGSGSRVALLPCHYTLAPLRRSGRWITWSPTQAVCRSDVICCNVDTACQWQQNTKSFPGINIYSLWEKFPGWISRTCLFVSSMWCTIVFSPSPWSPTASSDLSRSHFEGLQDHWKNRMCCKKWEGVIWISSLPWDLVPN